MKRTTTLHASCSDIASTRRGFAFKNTLLFLSLFLFIVLLGGCTAHDDRPEVLVGLMDATEIDVASKIPGRISSLLVHEGDSVEKGQKLLTIESHELEAKLAQVDSVIQAASAQLKMAQNGAREEQKRAALRQLKAARHQVEVTKKMYDRISNLVAKDALPKAKLDEAEFKYKVSVEQEGMAQAGYDAVMKGARDEEIEALTALLQQAKATRSEVESYNSETVQTAPISGEVSGIVLHKGELAATGYPIITLVDLSDQWASFSVREDLLQGITKGTRLRVEIPALGRDVEMEVFSLAVLGEFATWRATSDQGSFDLKTFEVRARPVETVDGLRPGMTVRWRLEAEAS